MLTEFLSPQFIMDMPEEELLQLLAEKSRNRISDIHRTADLLKRLPVIHTDWTSACMNRSAFPSPVPSTDRDLSKINESY